MKLKSELYKSEQEEICDKVIDILELDNKNSFVLYELDNNTEKQQKIIDLIPEIRKYFSFSSMTGVSNPNKVKRPYMSIIRNICKLKYNVIPTNYYVRIDKDTRKKSMKYFMILNQ